jgi:hypothetical protein
VFAAVCAALGVAVWPVASLAATPELPANDPFYVYGGSLKGIAPGTVLRTRQVSVGELGIQTPLSATQVLYRTTGELGQATVTVATIIKPLVPLGQTKIVSFQQAYDALGTQCDTSYTLRGGNPADATAALEDVFIDAYVAEGYTVVDSDYEGETLDYGAGQESGYGTLDAVRAAEKLLNVPVSGTPVGLVGYSGGAIASEYAAELAPTYAPELRIVGAAIGGIPTDFAHTLAYINGSKGWAGAIPDVLSGLARGFKLDFPKYLSSYGQSVVNAVAKGCLVPTAYPGLTFQKLLKAQYANYTTVPVFAHVLNKMIMSSSGPPSEPLLLVNGNSDGTGDGVMIAKDVQQLAYAYCQRGVRVQFHVFNGLDHIGAAVPFEPMAVAFLTQRLSGLSVSNGCSSITPGNALTPLPVPPSAPVMKAKHKKPSTHKRPRHRRRPPKHRR